MTDTHGSRWTAWGAPSRDRDPRRRRVCGSRDEPCLEPVERQRVLARTELGIMTGPAGDEPW